MAQVLPLYRVKGQTAFRKMSQPMIEEIIQRCVYLYGSDPSVTIEITGTGTLFTSFEDTRLRASAAVSSSGDGDGTSGDGGDFPATSDADQISGGTFEVGRVRTASLTEPVDTDRVLYPLYWDGSNIRSMTKTDMFDTFITHAIDRLVDGADTDGTFKLVAFDDGDALTHSNHTLVGDASTFIFKDTIADTSLYTSGGIPETRDQPKTHKVFHAFRTNQGVRYGNPTIQHPVYTQRASGFGAFEGIRTYTSSSFDTILLNEIKYYATQHIAYTFVDPTSAPAGGQQKGTLVTDTRLDGSTRVKRIQGNVPNQTYRAQEFPSGTQQTIATKGLYINRV